jgi:hypothetical protein
MIRLGLHYICFDCGADVRFKGATPTCTLNPKHIGVQLRPYERDEETGLWKKTPIMANVSDVSNDQPLEPKQAQDGVGTA